MKKLLLSIVVIFIYFLASAQTYFVSPNGNDAANGSQTTPWKTVRNALLSVTTSGKTIHLLPGTYVESGSTLNLAAGVNLEGENAATTIIKSGLTGQFSTFLNLESSGVTNGNQRISGITFDGQYVSESNYKTWIGVWVTFRSNVVFDSCVFQNFYNRGLLINGNGDNRSTIPIDPKIYTTGNKVTNCRFINTGGNDGNTYGQLNIGGTKDALIQYNYFDQTQRAGARNGECIKYWGSGYNPGLKILNNTLKRANHVDNQYNGSNGDWNFAIELFNNTGLEIAGNTIQGSIDLNYNRVVAPYTYSVWIHDNISDHNPFNQKEEQGIIFEFETSKATVENNKFNNLAMGITFNIRTPSNNGGYNNPKPVGGYSATTDVTIQNNLFTNLYSAFSYGNCCSAAGIQFLTEGGTNDGYVRNLLISNNTFVTKSANAAVSGLDLTNFTAAAASTNGITISKNIFVGFTGQYLEGGSAKMLNTVTKDNDIWQCGNNNNPLWSGSLTNTGNISSNPNFDANYVSPLGIALGIGYNAGGAPPPPNPCTYTYSAYGPCVNGIQTRTVVSSSPAGCTGTPILTQSCQTNNAAPVADAGPAQVITLPLNYVTLIGSGTDSDGTIASYSWSQNSGPNTATIANPSSSGTLVTGLIQGVYVFKLTVTDNLGATGTATVQVTVNPATTTNNPPVVDAGPDQTFSMTFTLSGSATDSDGTIASYSWKKISGPTCTIVSPASAQTVVRYTRYGVYVFELTAKDDKGATTKKQVTITAQY